MSLREVGIVELQTEILAAPDEIAGMEPVDPLLADHAEEDMWGMHMGASVSPAIVLSLEGGPPMSLRLRGQHGETYVLGTAAAPRRGGYGEVHPVEVRGQTLAVKLAQDADSNPSLIRERDALLQLRGEAGWVVPLLDHGESSDGRVFLVLPWFEHSLRSWNRQDPLPPLWARLEAGRQACRAVIGLHRSAPLGETCLHRDIKPDNLLISESPQLSVVLADLGGIKAGQLLTPTFHTGLATPEYAPPEQLYPLRLPLRASADVYALAATLYELLTGALPRTVLAAKYLLSDEGEELDVLSRASARTPSEEAQHARLCALPLDQLFCFEEDIRLPEGDVERLLQVLEAQGGPEAGRMHAILVPVLTRALQPDPRRRLGDPNELYAALKQCLDLLGVPEPTPAPPPSAPAAPRPRRLWLAGAAVLLLGAVGAVAAASQGDWWGAPESPQALGMTTQTEEEVPAAPSVVSAAPSPEPVPSPAPVLSPEPPAVEREMPPSRPPPPEPEPPPVAAEEPPPPARPSFIPTLLGTHSRAASPGVLYAGERRDGPFLLREGAAEVEVRQRGMRSCEGTLTLTAEEGRWRLGLSGRPPVWIDNEETRWRVHCDEVGSMSLRGG